MRRCIEWYVVVVLLMVLVPAAAGQPLHEQEREWVNIAPDTLWDNTFDAVRVGYSGDERVIYAISRYGVAPRVRKLIRSDDGGRSWEIVYDDEVMADDWTESLYYVHPWQQDADVLYGITFSQVLKSVDGGETWEDLTGNRYIEPTRVEVSPLDSARVVLANSAADPGALVSEDGGRSWRTVGQRTGGSHESKANVVLSLTDTNRFYLWTEVAGTTGRFPWLGATDDGGATFETRHRNLYLHEGAHHLMIDEEGLLYSGASISRDGGRSWEGAGRFVEAVAEEGALAVARTEGAYYVSYDRTDSWSALPGAPPAEEVRPREIDERDSTIFAISQAGLWAYARPGALGTSADEAAAVPKALELEAYPNPVRERAIIAYVLPEAGQVRLAAYDVLGRRVRALVDAWQAAGRHQVRLEASELPAGVYLVRLEAGGRVQTGTLLLVR